MIKSLVQKVPNISHRKQMGSYLMTPPSAAELCNMVLDPESPQLPQISVGAEGSQALGP